MLVATACGSSTPAPAPKLTGTLVFDGFGDNGTTAFWRVTETAGGTFTATQFRPEPTSPMGAVAAVSPDGRDFAITPDRPDDGFGLYGPGVSSAPDPPDIAITGPTTADCLVWSPDGRHIASTVGGDVYVQDTAGHETQVLQQQPVRYGNGSQFNNGKVVDPPVTCPAWLDDNHLVFDRRRAEMPAQITPNETIPTDTTTIAEIAPQPRLLDSPDRWSLVDACGGHLLTKAGDHYYLTTPPAEDRLTVRGVTTPAGGRIDVAQSSPGLAVALFDRATCDVVILAPDATDDNDGHNDTVTILDPANGHQLSQWRLTVMDSNGSSLADPDAHFFTSPAKGSPVLLKLHGDEAQLVDLTTGGATDVTGQWPENLTLLAWLS